MSKSKTHITNQANIHSNKKTPKSFSEFQDNVGEKAVLLSSLEKELFISQEDMLSLEPIALDFLFEVPQTKEESEIQPVQLRSGFSVSEIENFSIGNSLEYTVSLENRDYDLSTFLSSFLFSESEKIKGNVFSDGSDGSDGSTNLVAPPFIALNPQDQLVNDFTASDQYNSSIAFLDDGSYVIIWSGYGESGWGVFGQKYGSDGNKSGKAFELASHGMDRYDSATVVALSDGKFVVIWDSHESSGDYNVMGQIFNSSGTSSGNAFTVNTETDKEQYGHSVSVLEDGSFVVVWHSYAQGDDRTDFDIYGQKYDSDGNKVGFEFSVNSHNTPSYSTQWNPTITSLSGGGFIVLWEGEGVNGAVGNQGIYGQIFDGKGSSVGGELTVSVGVNKGDISLVQLSGGDIVVSWTVDNNGDTSVYGHILDSNGSPTSGEFEITGDGSSSSLVALSDGGFVVVWSGSGSNDITNIYGQIYNSDGSISKSEFQLNTQSTSSSSNPYVVVSPDGGFVVVWENGTDIYTQSFDSSGNPLNSSASETWIYGVSGAVSVVGDGQAHLEDDDDVNASSMVITIENYVPGDQLSILDPSLPMFWFITIVDGKFVMTIAGEASHADYIAALEELVYDFTGAKEDVPGENRVISIVVKDPSGNVSNVVTTEIEVSANEDISSFNNVQSSFLEDYIIDDFTETDFQLLFATDDVDYFTFGEEDTGMIFYILDFDPNQDLIDLSSVFDDCRAEVSVEISQGENGHSIIEVSQGEGHSITIQLDNFVDEALLQSSIIGIQGDDIVI